jgi:hypothetical protein
VASNRWQSAGGFLDLIKPFGQDRSGPCNIDAREALAATRLVAFE